MNYMMNVLIHHEGERGPLEECLCGELVNNKQLLNKKRGRRRLHSSFRPSGYGHAPVDLTDLLDGTYFSRLIVLTWRTELFIRVPPLVQLTKTDQNTETDQ